MLNKDYAKQIPSAIEQFNLEKKHLIKDMALDNDFQKASLDWFLKSTKHKYSYVFTWMGIPIIQYPNDIMLYQELIFDVKPDLIIETGIAHGGSIVFSASMLELLAISDPSHDGHVIGLDIDIRRHNKERLENHPMIKRITMLEGSSTEPEIIAQVKKLAEGKKKIMLSLDSNHTHQHVLDELNAYASLVTVGSYCIVWDTVTELIPAEFQPNDRPWGIGNSPMTAVNEFLKNNDSFLIDQEIRDKAIITVAPNGFLKRIK